MTTAEMFVDVLGWLGALILIAAYGFISYGSASGRSPTYQISNIVGSALLIVNTAWHRAWPSSIVNVVWVVIAIAALIRGLKNKILTGEQRSSAPDIDQGERP